MTQYEQDLDEDKPPARWEEIHSTSGENEEIVSRRRLEEGWRPMEFTKNDERWKPATELH